MVKKNKTRITFSTTKKQAWWIENSAKKLAITKSEFIYNALKVYLGRLQDHYFYTEEQMQELYRIARTPWLLHEMKYYDEEQTDEEETEIDKISKEIFG